MTHLAKILAVSAALAAVPALAGEPGPIPGSDRDPFSQTYTGPHREDAHAKARPTPERDNAAADRSRRACTCGDRGAPDHEISTER